MIDPVMDGYKVTTLGDDIAWMNVGPTASFTASTRKQDSSVWRPVHQRRRIRT